MIELFPGRQSIRLLDYYLLLEPLTRREVVQFLF
jgi:hypothetical protein